MMLLSATRTVAYAVALTLATQSARNMIQTARITRSPSSSTPSLLSIAATHVAKNDADATISTSSVVDQLQKMKRKDVIELFCQSQPPTNGEVLIGDWNGCLLENNSKIMTLVSTILTHKLFGRGYRQWNGKAFLPASRGINRFFSSKSMSSNAIATCHEFEYSLQPSRVQPGTTSILLQYSKYHPLLSPWHTMMDEVRALPENPDILIGMGCVAWGGGVLNAAPFCLWRDVETISSI